MDTPHARSRWVRILVMLAALAVLASACASDPIEPDFVAQAGPTPSPTATTAPVTPTALVVPTIVAATPTPTSQPTSSPTPVAPTATAVQPTGTPVPPTATTVPPTATATSTPIPQPTATTVPPTATSIPQPTATPTAIPTPWVNPDCFVGPGAADEPAWWCGGQLCVVGAPHYGCPNTPATAQVQIGCTISPRHGVEVNESLTFTAFQKPSWVPVTYAFDHGDGTLDVTNVSYAYYTAPGFYDVILRWQHAGGKGSTFCGTVTVNPVDPVFHAGDYLNRSAETAEAIAIAKGFIVRITRIDDIVFPGTDDYRTDRVNFEIDANIVTSASVG